MCPSRLLTSVKYDVRARAGSMRTGAHEMKISQKNGSVAVDSFVDRFEDFEIKLAGVVPALG